MTDTATPNSTNQIFTATISILGLIMVAIASVLLLTHIVSDGAALVRKTTAITTFLPAAESAIPEDATDPVNAAMGEKFDRVIRFRKQDVVVETLPVFCAAKNGQIIPLEVTSENGTSRLETFDIDYSIPGLSKWTLKRGLEKMRLPEVQAFCDKALTQ